MMELQQYDFEIKHRSRKSNTNADALSRMVNDVKRKKRSQIDLKYQKDKDM